MHTNFCTDKLLHLYAFSMHKKISIFFARYRDAQNIKMHMPFLSQPYFHKSTYTLFRARKNAHKLIMPILRLTKFMFLYLANNIEKPLFSAGQ